MVWALTKWHHAFSFPNLIFFSLYFPERRGNSHYIWRGMTRAAKVLTCFAVKALHVWAMSDWWGWLLKVGCGSVNTVIIPYALTSHMALVCGFSSTRNKDYATLFFFIPVLQLLRSQSRPRLLQRHQRSVIVVWLSKWNWILELFGDIFHYFRISSVNNPWLRPATLYGCEVLVDKRSFILNSILPQTHARVNNHRIRFSCNHLKITKN